MEHTVIFALAAVSSQKGLSSWSYHIIPRTSPSFHCPTFAKFFSVVHCQLGGVPIIFSGAPQYIQKQNELYS